MTQILTDLAQLEVAAKRCKDEYEGQMVSILQELFRKFFDAVPEIKTVIWDQETIETLDDDNESVYVFAVTDVGFNQKAYKDDEFDIDESIATIDLPDELDLQQKYLAMIAIKDILPNIGETLKTNLGDGVVCYATADGIFVENLA